MNRLLLLALCMIGLPSCTSQAMSSKALPTVADSPDEKAERDAILRNVQAAIKANDFSRLSEMGDEFRTSRARTPSGTWKLAVFHAGLQAYLAEGLERSAGCQYQQAQFIQRWQTAAPHDPAPLITDAALRLEQAWCVRGYGYASTVTEEAWPIFRKGTALAYDALIAQETMASTDPEFYAVKLNILGAQGVDRKTLRDLVTEATEREPRYHRIYYNAAWFHLPRWGGSHEELEEFVRYAAKRTRITDGIGFYARVFWWLEESDGELFEQAVDWPTMKRAMRDLYYKYPVYWNGEHSADLSCRMGDREEGRRYIRAIHPEAVDEASFAALFAACDNLAANAR